MESRERTAFIHVDIDSPRVLMRFWGLDPASADVDRFYKTAMDRAMELFARLGVQATFFCVGEELRLFPEAGRKMTEAYRLGHELANHTDSHPYNLSSLGADAAAGEIRRCSAAITALTGKPPVGFRAPSYGINENIFSVLRADGFWYDSSASWNALLPVIKTYHALASRRSNGSEFGAGSSRIPRSIYFPDPANWQRALPGSRIFPVEIPVPHTTWLKLPFYNNFHLLTGEWYRDLSFWRMNLPWLVYLVHLIELVDLTDGLPPQLAVHPTVRQPASKKIRFLEKSLKLILERYVPERTDTYVARRWAPDGAGAEVRSS